MSVFAWIVIITGVAGVIGTGLGGLLGAVLQRDSSKIVSLLLAFAVEIAGNVIAVLEHLHHVRGNFDPERGTALR